MYEEIITFTKKKKGISASIKSDDFPFKWIISPTKGVKQLSGPYQWHAHVEGQYSQVM